MPFLGAIAASPAAWKAPQSSCSRACSCSSSVPAAALAGRLAGRGDYDDRRHGAATVIDPLASRGIEVGAPSEDTYARFESAGTRSARARLIDPTLVGTRYEVMKPALDIITTAPEFDLIVAVVGSSARFHPELAVRPIVDSAAAAKPIAAFLVPEAPQARAELAKAGVANFYTPEACADAVAAALSRRLLRAIPTVARPPRGCSTDARTDAGLLAR